MPAFVTDRLSVFDQKFYYKGGFDAAMDKREASKILGVSVRADKKRIADAHRRLMLSGIHPDKGGSALLTTKINEAKDVLLQSAKNSA